MSDTRKAIETFYDDLKDYLNTRVELATLIATEKAAGVLSTLITKGTFIIVFFFAILFGSIAAALYIGEKRHSMFEGFLWIAAIYFIIGIIFMIINDRWLKKPILNAFIKQFYSDDK